MYQKILVPTDGSPTAQRGLEEACQLAEILKAELEILYVVDSRIIYADFSGVANFGELIDNEDEENHDETCILNPSF